MLSGMSTGAKALAGRAGQVSRAVSNFGQGRGQAYGNKLVRGANLGTRRGQATAMAGSAIGNASRYAAKNPNRAMGIAAGVTGAGAYGVNRRRGSQNYPMY
jgi:hypothetical protein